MEILNRTQKNAELNFEIRLAPDELIAHERSALRELGADLEVSGFRKGRAPGHIVKGAVGEEKVFAETLRHAVQATAQELVARESIEYIGQPAINIRKASPGNPFEFTLAFTVVPRIELGEWKGIRVIRKRQSVDEDELKNALSYVRNSRVKIIAVQRPAAMGDVVAIDFTAHFLDGAKIEGGEGRQHPFVLGEGKFVQGFEEKLVGMSSGEECEFQLSFPETWPHRGFAGRPAIYKVKITNVAQRLVPEFNDDFVRSLGSFQSLQELRESVKEGLLLEKQEKEKERSRMEALERICDRVKIDIPPILLEQEKDKIFNELRESVEGAGLDFDAYLTQLGKSEGELRGGWNDVAGKRVKMALTLRALGAQESIVVSEQEVKEKMDIVLRVIPGIKKNIDPKEIVTYAKAMVRNEKALELIEHTVVADELAP